MRQPSRRLVVLDTCVLLADPTALANFPDTELVIPLTVIEELDAKKTLPDEIGRAARQVLNQLEALRAANGGDLASNVALEGNATLRILTNGLHLDALRKARLDPRKNDNRILAAALGLADGSDRPVTVCSLDAALRIKAAQLSLGAESYLSSAPIRLEGLRTVDVDPDLVQELYAGASIALSDVHFVLEENGIAALRSGSTSVLVRCRGGQLTKMATAKSAYGLTPRSAEQHAALDLLGDRSLPIVALTGHAGTGKSILALAAGLEQCFSPHRAYDRLMILRPMVAVGRQDLGYLPGDVAEKLGPWFEAVIDTLVALKRGLTHAKAREMADAWVASDQLTLAAPTFLRGRSLQSTFVISDEAQNLEPLVAKTILSRLGADSKVVFLGDTTQIDSPWLSESRNSLSALIEHATGSALFGSLHLLRGERSPAADLAATMP